MSESVKGFVMLVLVVLLLGSLVFVQRNCLTVARGAESRMLVVWLLASSESRMLVVWPLASSESRMLMVWLLAIPRAGCW